MSGLELEDDEGFRKDGDGLETLSRFGFFGVSGPGRFIGGDLSMMGWKQKT